MGRKKLLPEAGPLVVSQVRLTERSMRWLKRRASERGVHVAVIVDEMVGKEAGWRTEALTKPDRDPVQEESLTKQRVVAGESQLPTADRTEFADDEAIAATPEVPPREPERIAGSGKPGGGIAQDAPEAANGMQMACKSRANRRTSAQAEADRAEIRAEIARNAASALDSGPKPECTHQKRTVKGAFVECDECGAIKVGPNWMPRA